MGCASKAAGRMRSSRKLCSGTCWTRFSDVNAIDKLLSFQREADMQQREAEAKRKTREQPLADRINKR